MKVALVTGAAQGIGQRTAEVLAQRGFSLALNDLRSPAETLALVRSHGVDALEVLGNVSDESAVLRMAEAVMARFGRIDVLVNNAGVIRDNPLAALDDDDIKAVLDTNIGGVFNMSRAVVPYMVMQRAGTIVNLSSVAGEKGGRGQTNYAASKGAVNAFTRALAVELGPRKIRVNAVAPGVIDTEMSQGVRDLAGDETKARILMRRYGTAQDVAYAVWFLASDYANYVTGQVFHIDGGFKLE